MPSLPTTSVYYNSSDPAPPSGDVNVVFQSDNQVPQASLTAFVPPFVGDTGSGGIGGGVPAPAIGDAALGKFLYANGTWAIPGGIYHIGFGVPGKPANGSIVGQHTVAIPVGFLANFGGAVGYCGTNPTATATFTIWQIHSGSSTQIGSIIVATSGVFTFTTTAGAVETLAMGDTIQIIAPNPQDSTLANISYTLPGTQ